MARKTVFVLLFGITATLSACAGPMGKGEGETCKSADDCSSNLTCQPIMHFGSSNDVCCPTPPQSSKNTNCQPNAGSADGG